MESSLDYSLSNTTRQALWLVTSRGAKYKAKQVIDAFFFGLHVAVKHGGVGMKAEFVSLARDAEPHLAADFVVADEFTDAGVKNFRTAARQGIDAGVFHFLQRFLDGELGDAREVADFHHGEGFEMHGGTALLEAANHVQKIFKGQIGMQATNHVELGGAFAHALFSALVNFFESEGIRAGSVGVASESAQFAMRDAYVGGIDVPVDVEIGDIPVAFFAYVVGEPAYREEVG